MAAPFVRIVSNEVPEEVAKMMGVEASELKEEGQFGLVYKSSSSPFRVESSRTAFVKHLGKGLGLPDIFVYGCCLNCDSPESSLANNRCFFPCRTSCCTKSSAGTDARGAGESTLITFGE